MPRPFGRATMLLLFFVASLFAKPEIHNDSVLIDTAVSKIYDISSELHEKTGVNIYIYAKKTLDGKSIVDFENTLLGVMQKPYALLVFAESEQKVDIVLSEELQKRVDKNEILNNFIIPILVTKDDQPVNSRYSAALLNGTSELCERLAASYNVTLVSGLGNESRNVINIIRAVFYSIIGFSLLIVFYRFLKRKGYL